MEEGPRQAAEAQGMITLDTSGVIAMLDRRDASHEQVAAVLRASPPALVIPVPVLAEMTYMVEARVGSKAVQAFTASLERGAFILDCCADDYAGANDLTARYDDLPLPFTDAVIATCAVRNGGSLITTDRRDFAILVQGDARLTLLP